MNWAVKLFKKMISPLEAWDRVPNEDPKDFANTKSVLVVDDFREAVLEKNKEIDKIDLTYEWKGTQARAFRELVQACEKVKK